MAIAIFFGLLSCSEKKSEPLPNLQAIAIPSDMIGTYSGQLPCDDCKVQMIRADFSADSNVTLVRSIVKDSIVMDTLHGKFSMTIDSVVSVTSGHYSWKFKRNSFGNLFLMNGAGEIYIDKDGLKCEWLRIYALPKTTPAKTIVDSLKKAEE